MKCTRRDDDPLLQRFLDMRINPFMIAREENPLGLVYLISPGSKARQQVWRQTNVFTPKLENVDKDELTTRQDQVLESTFSNKMDSKAAANILASRIPGLAGDAKAEVKALLDHNAASSVSLRLTGVTGERLRVDQLQIQLGKRDLSDAVRRVRNGARIYVATGAWCSRGLEVTAMNSSGNSVDLSAGLAKIASASATLSTTHEAHGQCMFVSTVPLYFGVELMKVREKDGALHLDDYHPEDRVAGEVEDSVYKTALADIWTNDDIIALIEVPGDGTV